MSPERPAGFWPASADTLDLDRSQRPAVARLSPWIFCAVVTVIALVAAVSWSLSLRAPTSADADEVPASQPWVDPLSGASFQVTSVTEATEIDKGFEKLTATGGATYLIWQIKVTGVTEAKKKLGERFLCSFTLVGQRDEVWESDGFAVPADASIGCNDESFASGSGTVTSVFVVPQNRVDQLRGIQPYFQAGDDQPPILRRP